MKDILTVLGSALVFAVFAHVSNAAHLHPRETPPPSRLEHFDVIAPVPQLNVIGVAEQAKLHGHVRETRGRYVARRRHVTDS